MEKDCPKMYFYILRQSYLLRNQVSWGQNGVNLKKLYQSILMLKNKRTALLCGSKHGGTPGVRTLDPLIKSQMLCQLS